MNASFNVWSEPWIGVIRANGSREIVSIATCLERAHEFASLYEMSPLVVGGIHRLLTAIVQAMYAPTNVEAIAAVLRSGTFAKERIDSFGTVYSERFDLFSEESPFLQTADAPITPTKNDKPKSVAYLAAEIPAGTAVTHFHHQYDEEHHFCPRCAAGGLVMLSAFATSGGSGIKPSINGVPPLYVFPTGPTLFASLTRSLIAPNYQPKAADAHDAPIWTSDTAIQRGGETITVGYLQSLTFPARRVRLYPEEATGTCSRCGQSAQILVTTMLFEMGLSRPKGAAAWLDPFAAYIQPLKASAEPVRPMPVRPIKGKALWRDYATLFLTVPEEGKTRVIRPAVVAQMDDLAMHGAIPSTDRLLFRCIGMRTDMKAKIFEWTDDALEVPIGLLQSASGGRMARRAITHAEECSRQMAYAFQQLLGKRGRHKTLVTGMQNRYWIALASPFQEFALVAANGEKAETAVTTWDRQVLSTGRTVFGETVDLIGDQGADLRLRVQAKELCGRQLEKLRKEWLS